jgi:hypothetical protein
MRCAGHVTCIGEVENNAEFGLETLNERDHLGNIYADERTINLDLNGKSSLRIWILFV